MGFFSKLFAETVFTFKPDFSKTEYENWLEYLHVGGTDSEWKELKKRNHWKFKPDPIEKFSKYDSELRPVFSEYGELIKIIKEQWSALYNSNNYTGQLAQTVERNCIKAISYYKEIQSIDIKYNQDLMTGSPAFTKLALLYERQGNFDKSILVCKAACKVGIDEKSRLKRMIKKAGHTPTAEELKLIDN